MKHTFQWFQSSIIVFFIISLFDPLQTSDAYLEPSKMSRKSLYNYLLNGARYVNIRSNKNPQFSKFIPNKYFLSRPVRRIGSEFLGKRSLTLFPIATDEKENVNKENDNFVAFKGKHLYNFNENSKFRPKIRDKRGVNSFENRRIKSLVSFLLRNRDDYFGKRFGYYSKGKPYTPYGYNRDIVGSEFLGKRSLNSSEFDKMKIKEIKESIDENNNDEIVQYKDDEATPYSSNFESEELIRARNDFDQTKGALGSEFLGKRDLGREILGKRALGSEFLGKRALGSEFLGKRALEGGILEKRALGSEFLGKRALGSEFLGKRALGSEFLGKRALGSEFLGKRALGSEFLGKRALGSEFLGKRALGSEFLGKRAIGNEFLGKRAIGSEFLGKRDPNQKISLQIIDQNDLHNISPEEYLGKRALGSEFLGKRNEGMAIFLKGNDKQEPLRAEHENFEYIPQNMSFENFKKLQSGNYSQLPPLLFSEMHENNHNNLNSNNVDPLYNVNIPSKYFKGQS